MALIYVTGSAGSGKSTVQNELLKLGYEAFDEDDPDIGSAHNKKTNQAAKVPPLNERTSEWFSEHEWRIFPVSLKRLKDISSQKPVFLCGNAATEQQLKDYFDIVIFLDTDEQTLRHRISSREDNDFGKSEDELQTILERNEAMKNLYVNNNCVVIDASQPLDTVMAQILQTATNNITKK